MTTFVGTCVEKIFELTQAIGFPSYAAAIVIITIIIKLILFPLNQKQIKSTKNMQVIQPQVMELNKKYANNPQKKSEELMKLYKEYNINPMAGCLPLLIQLPIIMILYRGLLNFTPRMEKVNQYRQMKTWNFVAIYPIIKGITMIMDFCMDSLGIPIEVKLCKNVPNATITGITRPDGGSPRGITPNNV